MFSLLNFTNINKIFNFQLLIFFAWIAMWVSINSGPGELSYMFNDKITFINGMRTIFAIIFSILMIILALSLSIKDHKQLNKKSIILIIFLIHFISQIVGLSLNPDRAIDLNNIYLVLYSLSTISILYIIQNRNYQNLIPFLIYFMIFILAIYVIFVASQNPDKILETLYTKSFYTLIHPDIAFNYQAPPRITGFSRTLAIINIFLLVIFFINYKKIYSIPLFLIIYIFSVIIWLSQSRGTIICYYLSSLILVFLFNNMGFVKKIFMYLTITLFSIIGSNFIGNFADKKIEIAENLNEKSNSLEKNLMNEFLEIEKSRFVTQKNTSGRTQLWNEALTKYEYKNFFGLGPQADRLILFDYRDKYGNNVSNAMIYALLSGGYPSIICIILIYIYSCYLILFFFIKEKLYKFSFKLNYRNSLNVVSISFVIFFMIRSIIENSFSLFSIDFLITILSLFVLEQIKYKKK